MRSKWLLFIVVALLSCNGGTTKKADKTTDSAVAENGIPMSWTAESFWDSVLLGKKLSDAQMKKFTIVETGYWSLDSFYISNDSTLIDVLGFKADSVYTSGKFKVAILTHSGPNCATKFLLVFDSTTTRNLSYTLLGEACDRDGEMAYSYQEYKILSDSTVVTTLFDVPENAEVDDKNVKRYVTLWKIDGRGIIDSIPSGKDQASKP